ncbi:hypothetical protein DID88_007788 [Monilinia fructigena]|uniref:Uncharacterized protein n=1 Tax=Monilinia fructigena TaxID=38457 RepID=A0A395J4D3_9HELO|nr:hypothetical protein DID88_007788 [Monilinia fructigena]
MAILEEFLESILKTTDRELLPDDPNASFEDGNVWPGFLAFMKDYLEFWRDVNFDDLLETHSQLTALASTCLAALSNPTYGIVILPTAIQLSTALAKLAMTLDKRPDLTRRLRRVADVDAGENRKTLVEGTAETIQRAFTMGSQREESRHILIREFGFETLLPMPENTIG